jgi:hypothetical protein
MGTVALPMGQRGTRIPIAPAAPSRRSGRPGRGRGRWRSRAGDLSVIQSRQPSRASRPPKPASCSAGVSGPPAAGADDANIRVNVGSDRLRQALPVRPAVPAAVRPQNRGPMMTNCRPERPEPIDLPTASARRRSIHCFLRPQPRLFTRSRLALTGKPCLPYKPRDFE